MNEISTHKILQMVWMSIVCKCLINWKPLHLMDMVCVDREKKANVDQWWSPIMYSTPK